MLLFGDETASLEHPHLRRAARLALRGLGAVHPNPLVGCVIVRDGEVVGEGFHAESGGPHAEVVALAEADGEAEGAECFVTLEPCAHHGRTPPCTDALIAAGVARVTIGMPDPNPGVTGGGARLLAEAGVEVTVAEDPSPFELLNEDWLRWIRSGRRMPWVDAKVALSLDGRPALRPGERARITGGKAARLTARLRSASDAVLVGAETVRVDDPALTVRDEDGVPAERQPLRVVLCRSTLPDPAARVFSDGPGGATLLVPTTLAGEAARTLPGIRLLPYDADAGLRGALGELARHDVVRLLVEPGPRLLASLVDADAVDRLVVLHAGGFAGEDAPGAVARPSVPGPPSLHRRYRAVETSIVGGDAVTVWRRREGAPRVHR